MLNVFTICSLLTIQNKFVETELSRYIKQYDGCNSLDRKLCCYIHDNSNLSKDIVSKYISTQETCSNLLQSMEQRTTGSNKSVKCDDIYVLIGKIKETVGIGKFFENSTFWDQKSKVHIVVYTPVLTKEVTYKVLKYIWNQKIYNFLFVIVNREFEVFSYNYFTKAKLKLTKNSSAFCENLFLDKIKNMQGATIKVALLQHIPFVYWNEKNDSLIGADVNLMNLFARITNCRLKVLNYRNKLRAFDSIRKVDIFFTGMFQVRKDIFSSSYFLDSSGDGLSQATPQSLIV